MLIDTIGAREAPPYHMGRTGCKGHFMRLCLIGALLLNADYANCAAQKPEEVQFFVPRNMSEERSLGDAIAWLAHNTISSHSVLLARGDDLVSTLKNRYGDAWSFMWPPIRTALITLNNIPRAELPEKPPPRLVFDFAIPNVPLPNGPHWDNKIVVVADAADTIKKIAFREEGRSDPDTVLEITKRNPQYSDARPTGGQSLVLTRSFHTLINSNSNLTETPVAKAARIVNGSKRKVEPIAVGLAIREQCPEAAKRKDYPIEWDELKNQLEINRAKGQTFSRTTVAVVDSGTSLEEPARNRIYFWGNPEKRGPENAQWIGYDLTKAADDEQDSWPEATATEPSYKNHGTHVAGIIQGAPSRRPDLIAEIKGFSQIVMLKVFPEVPGADIETIDEHSLQDAFVLTASEASRAKIVHMSIESVGENPAFEAMLKNEETLYVVAAGNRGQNVDTSILVPAWYGGTKSPNVLVVGSHNAVGDWDPDSNFGRARVDIAAPGECIESLSLGRSPYATYSGTSQAAPFVTMTAAIIMAYNYPARSTKHRIDISADYEPKFEEGKEHAQNATNRGDGQRTWLVGRLNAVKALSLWDDIVDRGAGSGAGGDPRYARGIVTTTTKTGSEDYTLKIGEKVVLLQCALKITPLDAISKRVRIWYAWGRDNDGDIDRVDGTLESDLMFGTKASNQTLLPLENFKDIVLTRSARIDGTGHSVAQSGQRCPGI
jgi:subtilisin family serine protease